MPPTAENTPTFEEQIAAEVEGVQTGDPATDDDGVVAVVDDQQQPPAVESLDLGDLTKLSPRDRALVERARREEKSKLYKQLNDMRAELKTAKEALRAAQAAPASTSGDANAEIRELREMVTSLQNTISQGRQEDRVRQYRADKLAQAKLDGVRVVEALVTGDSEEEIDITFDIAVQEARQFEQEIRRDMAPPQVPPAAPRRVVVQNNRQAVPGVVPVTPTRSSVRGDGSGDGFTAEEIKQLTSMESLRDGTWGRKRAEVLKALREGRVRA